MAFSPETYGAIKGLGGAAGGFATLDADGKVPEEQLPGGGGGGTIAETTGILKGDGNGNAVAAETEEAESIGIDTVVTALSSNLITSGAVAAAITSAIGNIDTLVGSGVIA